MRIALISDIHGNLVSLEAVLADIARVGVDRIVCLGDVAALGSQPREVIARLKALGSDCIMGNHDEHLLDLDAAGDLGPWIAEVTAWCADQLTEADLDFLRSFRPLLEIPLGAQDTLLCYHGSPRSNEERMLSTTPPEVLAEMLDGHTGTVLVGGHNHVQMLRHHKGMAVVDVGSVGQPFVRMPFDDWPRFLPCAEYGVVSWECGVSSVDLRRVPIDVAAAIQAAFDSDMPGAEEWAGWWSTPTEERRGTHAKL
jgi:predicted phosphodiesterase